MYISWQHDIHKSLPDSSFNEEALSRSVGIVETLRMALVISTPGTHTLWNPFPRSVGGTCDLCLTNRIWQGWCCHCHGCITLDSDLHLGKRFSHLPALIKWVATLGDLDGQQLRAAHRSWGWLLANSWQEKEALSTLTRNWILTTTMWSWKQILPQLNISWDPVSDWLLNCSLLRKLEKRTQLTVPRLMTYRNWEVMSMCCFKVLNLCYVDK